MNAEGGIGRVVGCGLEADQRPAGLLGEPRQCKRDGHFPLHEIVLRWNWIATMRRKRKSLSIEKNGGRRGMGERVSLFGMEGDSGEPHVIVIHDRSATARRCPYATMDVVGTLASLR